jgi:DNA-binding HxlR family transcriptional regulator
MGGTRFEELQIQTGATPQMLASRLKALEGSGMLERHAYTQRPVRYEYRLTEKGKAFYPVIHALRAWGETWCKSKGEDVAMHFSHRTCGHDIGLGNDCPICGTAIDQRDLVAELSPVFAKEREDRRLAFKAATSRD